MWCEDVFSYESHVVGKGFIAVFGKVHKSDLSCVVVNVYSACNMSEKKTLWEELTVLKQACHGSMWCLCGDFNAVRNRSERKGIRDRVVQSREIEGFNNFIDSNALLDLPVVGKIFTWFKADGSAKSRLDRVLVSDEWLEVWPMSKQYVQKREVSDHCAIVVKAVDKDWGPKPFRSIDAWFMEKGLSKMVEDKWVSYVTQGSALQKMKVKLKCLKGDLKIWNRDVYGNLHKTKEGILKEIEVLDCKDCVEDLTEPDKLRRYDLVGKLMLTDKKIDSLICQKARACWFKNGDSCTKFYNSSLRWRRLRNEVKRVVGSVAYEQTICPKEGSLGSLCYCGEGSG
ncbi:uncharacterized protein [Phaseolus vulgaris]|uniref:uncharacterized protein n=1 Tax=Phaseolus vulgaris TaxID=3885 RepID=UPI0035CC292A